MNVTLNVTLGPDGAVDLEQDRPSSDGVFRPEGGPHPMMHRCGADDPRLVEQRGSHSDATGAGLMPAWSP